MELFIFAGPNGSGKSTVLAQFIQKFNLQNYEYINPDIYARKFFSDITEETERYKAAFEFADYTRELCLEHNKDIIIETVNSTDNKFEFYRRCSERNYKTTVVFVCTSSPEINIARVNKRVSEGGHGVPEEKIISRYYRSLENLFGLSEFADVFYIYDNSKNFEIDLCVYKDDKESYQSKSIPKWVEQYYFEPLKKFL